MTKETASFDRFTWDDDAVAIVFGSPVPTKKAARYSVAIKRYNPNQPRDPEGEDGGRWIPAGGGSADGKSDPEVLEAIGNAILPAETKDLPKQATQPYSTWEDLRTNADASLAELNVSLRDMAKELGLRTDVDTSSHLTPEQIASKDLFVFSGIKAEERSRVKVKTEYDNDWTRLKDVVRANIAVDTVDQVKAVVDALYKRGLGFVEYPKNRFAQPTQAGYRDLLGVTRLKTGMLAEIQVQLKPLTAAKIVGHKMYEESRALQAKYDGEKEPTSRWSPEDTRAFHKSIGDQRKLYGAAWVVASGGAKSKKIAKEVEEMIAAAGTVMIENEGAIFRGPSVAFPKELWSVPSQKWVPYTGKTPKDIEWGMEISEADAKDYMDAPVEKPLYAPDPEDAPEPATKGARYVVTLKANPYHVQSGPDGGQFTSADAYAARIGDVRLSDTYDENKRRYFNVVDGIGHNYEIPFAESSIAENVTRQKDGTYMLSAERQALHDKIVDMFLEDVPRNSETPEMYMTGGGPAAGKSSMLRYSGSELGVPRATKPPSPIDTDAEVSDRKEVMAAGGPQAVLIDADSIKMQLPEYQKRLRAKDPTAAAYSHEESSIIARRLRQASIATGRSVVIDSTGDSSIDKLAHQVKAYRDAQYKIHAYYATNPTELAVQLAYERGQRTGRFVPPSVVREAHANVSRTFPKAISRRLFDDVRLYDTTVFTKPKLVVKGNRNTFKIVNPTLYDTFLAKGDADYATTAKEAEELAQKSATALTTNDIERIASYVVLGMDKSVFQLSTRASAMWDLIAADVAAMPEGAIIEVGKESPDLDYDKLYAGPWVDELATKADLHPGAIKNDQWVTIKRFDNDKQIVYGEVYAPMVLDTYGEFMTAEDIEVMAHRFMQLDLRGVIDTQHDTMTNGAYPIESFIARPNDPDYVEGSWVLGVKIPDSVLWSRVKSGELNGFSFQCLVKPTDVDVEYDTVRDYVGATELFADHHHTFFAELNEIGNVIGGRTSKAPDGHHHEITRASVTDAAGGHSHRFFL